MIDQAFVFRLNIFQRRHICRFSGIKTVILTTTLLHRRANSLHRREAPTRCSIHLQVSVNTMFAVFIFLLSAVLKAFLLTTTRHALKPHIQMNDSQNKEKKKIKSFSGLTSPVISRKRLLCFLMRASHA